MAQTTNVIERAAINDLFDTHHSS